MAKKYKFRKIFIHCVNGQAIERNIESATFWQNEKEAKKIFVQNGYHLKPEKYDWEKRADRYSLEGFYLVPAGLYETIIKPFDNLEKDKYELAKDFTEKLIALLKTNKKWVDNNIDPTKIISLVGETIWINLDGLPKNYKFKHVPSLGAFVASLKIFAKPLAVADQYYYFNFIFDKKSHPKNFNF